MLMIQHYNSKIVYCDYECEKPATWRRACAMSTLAACDEHKEQAEQDWNRIVTRLNHGI